MFNKSSIQILQMGQTWPNPHISALSSHFCILIFRRISTIYPDCWRSRLPRNSRIRRTGALIISSVQCQRGFPQKSDRCILFNTGSLLFGGLEHCFHILGIVIPNDFHSFQRRWNHQPDYFARSSKCFPTIWDFVGFITSDFRSIITWKLNWQELGFVLQKWIWNITVRNRLRASNQKNLQCLIMLRQLGMSKGTDVNTVYMFFLLCWRHVWMLLQCWTSHLAEWVNLFDSEMESVWALFWGSIM